MQNLKPTVDDGKKRQTSSPSPPQIVISPPQVVISSPPQIENRASRGISSGLSSKQRKSASQQITASASFSVDSHATVADIAGHNDHHDHAFQLQREPNRRRRLGRRRRRR